jgi:Fe-S-cluster-containing dehydrogenase component/CRP-like cAMP-binding protein
MNSRQIAVQRPRRWDTPFSADMTDADVERLMRVPPFSAMNEGAFSAKLPLRGILRNDCRIHRFSSGDIVIRQGDYGNSAFLVLRGTAMASLAPLPPELLGRASPADPSWFGTLVRFWNRSKVAEARPGILENRARLDSAICGDPLRIPVQDFPGIFSAGETLELHAGELFGELSAMTRTPRSATVVASDDCEMVEMRWQGFRDILRRDDHLRRHVESLYRQHSLQGHLRATPVLSTLPAGILEQVAAETLFESWGDFEWNRQFRTTQREDIARKIESEPVIAREGEPADGLILIRNGFARISRRHGDGHQTIAYAGKGQLFGLRELAHNWRYDEHRPWLLSLRAVGYVDILRIPQLAVEQWILPNVDASILPPRLPDPETPAAHTPGDRRGSAPGNERRGTRREAELETGLLEFLVEHRLINGTRAMLIDLDRCTRCDDCVRACAAVHDNNPRFVRQGPRHENWMFAGACMHCVDPVCMIGCPTGAIGRDEATGTIVINDQTCIGCGTCSSSCPYGNIRMVDIRDGRGVPLVDAASGAALQQATKCDLCTGLAGGPACQNACPHDALVRIDLTTPLPLYQLTGRSGT